MSLPTVIREQIRFESRIVPLFGRSFGRLVSLLLLLLVAQFATAQEQKQADLREPGQSIERELAGGQTHTYQVNLAAGQFVRVTVNRRGTNVVTAILAPDGKRLAEYDGVSDTHCLEAVSAIVTTTGSHLIEIKSLNKDAAVGHYEVKIAELRTATERDRINVAAQLVYAEAVRLYQQNNPEAQKLAIAKFNEARGLWQSAGSDLEEAAAKSWLAAHYVSAGDYRQAIELYLQIATFWQAQGNRRLEAEMLMRLGNNYRALREYQKSLDYLNQALTIFQSLGNRKREAESLIWLGSTYQVLREYQKSLDYFNRALTIFQSLGDGDAITLMNNRLALIYRFLGDNHKAIELYNISLHHWRALGNSSQVFSMLMAIGVSYTSLRNDQKAIEYHEQALAVAREIKDQALEANALTQLGIMYSTFGNNAKATDYYNQALQLHRETRNKIGEANIRNYTRDLTHQLLSQAL